MLVFVTTRSHANTVASLVDGSYGAAVPQVRAMAWDELFHARRLPRATYVLTDLERLAPWELRLAARVHRAAVGAGLRCLNDPARVRLRHALLHALHATGRNPFAVYRAEASPRPARFPVFVRGEADHNVPVTDLLADQAALDAALEALQASGIPLRFLLVIEFCAEPIAPGAWRKLGTFRVGPSMHVDHAVIEARWLVKMGSVGLATPEMFAAERDAVAANAGAEALRPVFGLAGIEYGRADHATVGGREVVYEINTNPNLYPLQKQRSPVRDEAQRIARARFAQCLERIDTPGAGHVRVDPAVPRRWQHRLAPAARLLGLSPDLRLPV